MEKACGPLRQNRRNLLDIFFGDELIRASLRSKQQGFDRPGRPIMWMKIKFIRRLVRLWKKTIGRKIDSVESSRNQCQGGALAESNQKVASTLVYGAERSRIPRFFGSTQGNVPSMLK